MATLKAVVRKASTDGFYPVYIRITHRRTSSFIKTDKMVDKKGLSTSNEIIDLFVMQYTTQRIIEFYNLLNKVNIEHWTAGEIADYLMKGSDDISFSDYAQLHINRMIDRGQERNARNYKLAVQHLERFAGTTHLMFSHLTSKFVNRWITTLETTRRAKEMYPIAIRQVFKAAILEFNDYDNGNLKIKTNPFLNVAIPSADRAEKIAITPEQCRVFFSAPIPDSKMKFPVCEFGRDIAMMILCLAGINTVDLYNLRKCDLMNGIIRYQRAKSKKSRSDGAYMEMKVPPIIQPLIDKYIDTTSSEYLFNFRHRFASSDSFNANANAGIKQLCASLNIPKEQMYSCYTFRHTWGTVAQNDVKASIADVAFALNHSAGYKITRGYIKIDYTPAWDLNDKVIDFIFFSENVSAREQIHEETHFRLSYRYMVNGIAYHNGMKLADLTDVGFNNDDEVIAKLISLLPEDIPHPAIVFCQITHVDKEQTVGYQRQKGHSF